MKRLWITQALAVLLLAPLAGPAVAHDFAQDGIKIAHPWARPTPPVSPINGAAYLEITNEGKQPARLTGVSTPLTPKASLHQTAEVDGQMRMTPVKGGLEIAPGETVAFEPGSYHVMLMNLPDPLEPGERFPLSLTFANGQSLEVEVWVEESEPAPKQTHNH